MTLVYLHLRVAAIDYAAQYIILPAFHAMKRIAPRISIELQQLNADTFRRLSLGLVDMAMRLECTSTVHLRVWNGLRRFTQVH